MSEGEAALDVRIVLSGFCARPGPPTYPGTAADLGSPRRTRAAGRPRRRGAGNEYAPPYTGQR